jgi:hypothetical protein
MKNISNLPSVSRKYWGRWKKKLREKQVVMVYGEHFKYFICLDTKTGQIEDKKVLYLTYVGVLKQVFILKK